MLSGNRVVVQRLQVVLGIQYRLVIVKNDTEASNSCCLYGHQFDISRDKNKDFHVFHYTTVSGRELMKSSVVHQTTMEKCNSIDHLNCLLADRSMEHKYSLKSPFVGGGVSSESIDTAHWGASTFPIDGAERFGGNLSPTDSTADFRGTLRVATYNIWNVNGLANLERYEDRLQRLRKVSCILIVH